MNPVEQFERLAFWLAVTLIGVAALVYALDTLAVRGD